MLDNVFINYSQADASLVERVVNNLRAAGMDVWYDCASLVAGASPIENINRAFKQTSRISAPIFRRCLR
ncbi:MAG TPA: toll/interleukin-1 receptor domain-containing protein [Ktedonobacterales bacterium]